MQASSGTLLDFKRAANQSLWVFSHLGVFKKSRVEPEALGLGLRVLGFDSFELRI